MAEVSNIKACCSGVKFFFRNPEKMLLALPLCRRHFVNGMGGKAFGIKPASQIEIHSQIHDYLWHKLCPILLLLPRLGNMASEEADQQAVANVHARLIQRNKEQLTAELQQSCETQDRFISDAWKKILDSL